MAAKLGFFIISPFIEGWLHPQCKGAYEIVNGDFQLTKIGDFRLTRNGDFRPTLTTNLLSDKEIRIVTSIIEHIERSEKRIGIQQIAQENCVSSTFIIKTCKCLGFEGYSELYYHLSQRMNASSRDSECEELKKLIDNYDEDKGKQFCKFLAKFQPTLFSTDTPLFLNSSRSHR